MVGIRSIAALALLAGAGVRVGDDLMAETERGDWDDVLLGGPAFYPRSSPATRRAAPEPVQHIVSPKALSKRQRRRLRGRG